MKSREFAEWLDANRDATVCEVFHDTVANFAELEKVLIEARDALLAAERELFARNVNAGWTNKTEFAPSQTIANINALIE